MADRKKPTEATQLLKTMPTEILAALSRIEKDKDAYNSLRLVLDSLLKDRQKKIVDSASGVVSMDSMIDVSINQSFYRGQVAMAVLVNSLIKNAPDFLDKRGEGQTKGRIAK